MTMDYISAGHSIYETKIHYRLLCAIHDAFLFAYIISIYIQLFHHESLYTEIQKHWSYMRWSMGFFSLMDKTSDGKYGWVVLKHDIETPHDCNGIFYIGSSLQRPWNKTTPPYGRIPPPIMQIS